MSQATAELVRRELGPVEITPIAAAPGYWKAVGQRLMRDPVTIAVTVILLGIIFISIAAPLVAGADPYAGSVLARLKPIGTPGHWLGTDETGRDLWARLCYGGRLSLLAGILPVPSRLPYIVENLPGVGGVSLDGHNDRGGADGEKAEAVHVLWQG